MGKCCRVGALKCTCLAIFSVVALAGVGCMIAGAVYFAVKGDPAQRQNQIDAYNAAYDTWSGPSLVAGSASAWTAAIGSRFTAVGDNSATLNLTAAAIEPIPVESGAGIDPYSLRAAYTTTSNVFVPTGYSSGNVVKNLAVYDGSGNLLFNRAVTLEQMITTSATQSCTTTGTGSNKHTTCTYSCSQGERIGTTCYMYLYPSNYGICLAVDPVTKQYSGGCAIMSPDAASVLDSSITPNRVGDIAYSYSNYPVSPVPWYNYPVTVRSSTDPWVVAAAETNGYLVFGIEAANYRKTGATLMGVGGGLLAPFFCILTLIICVAARECCSDCRLPAAEKPRARFRDRVSQRFVSTVSFGRYGGHPYDPVVASGGGAYVAVPAGGVPTMVISGPMPVGGAVMVPTDHYAPLLVPGGPPPIGVMDEAAKGVPVGPGGGGYPYGYPAPAGAAGYAPAAASGGYNAYPVASAEPTAVVVTPSAPRATAPGEEEEDSDPIGPVPSKRRIA